MFENKIINGVHTSRYIMSWVRSGGILGKRGQGYYDFDKWLKKLGLDDEDRRYIRNFASNGKLELEESVKGFLD